MNWKACLSTGICLAVMSIGPQVTAQEAVSNRAQKTPDCTPVVFVESPVADTYISAAKDTASFGSQVVLKLRGLPEKKKMTTILAYRVQHIDPNYVLSATLKIYTISKNNQSTLSVSSVEGKINESTLNWRDQSNVIKLLTSKRVTDPDYIEFDVTAYVQSQLQRGDIQFYLETDGKKTIEISSRESGLSSELAIALCTPVDRSILLEQKTITKTEYNLAILPSRIPGKFTAQLIGVPAGGFGDLMIMDEGGAIMKRFPMAIREGEVLYHTLDFGDLAPGIYWAVFRKGRVMVKDEFRLQPSQATDRLLEVQLDTIAIELDGQ